jgi:hypothetical protein
MSHQRTLGLMATFALLISAQAGAQTTPSSTSPPGPSSSPPSSENQRNDRAAPDGTAAADRAAANDPRLKRCIHDEKAKDNGVTDEQIKQKCLLHIASHQGEQPRN